MMRTSNFIYLILLITFSHPTMLMAAATPVDRDSHNRNERSTTPDTPSSLMNLTHAAGRSRLCSSSLVSGEADDAAREKTCSIDTSSEDVTKLALCPWTDTIDRDVNRVPQDIKAAKCLCGKCAGMHNSLKECRAIYKDVQVFRLNAVTGLFQSELELVPVACGCGIYSEKI